MITLEKIGKTKRSTNHIFKVPENYFEWLPSAIQQRISLNENPAFDSNQKQVFNVPASYFEKLSSKILNRIEQAEKSDIDLESLEKVNIFRIPEDYFDNLPERIAGKNTISIKEISVDWWSKGTVRWSAAASIVLAFGLWFTVPKLSKNKTEAALEKVSTDEIKTYLANQDLTYLEYQPTTELTQTQALESLKINKQAILEHLATQDVEEEI